ncbi:Ig-like domain-containing protein [Paenimyroides ceti]
MCDSNTSSAWTDAKKITTLCDYYEILTTTPGTVCGSGQVPLEVTYTGGDVRWYTVPTGGSVIATGNSFTTPEINTTTSYWVSSAVTGGINNTGISTPSSSATALTITNWGIIFNAIEDTALNSVSVYSTTAGTLNIKIQNSAGVEIYETGNVNILAGGTTSPNIIPLNFTVPAGTGYKMLVKNASGVSLIRESSNLTFPYTGADGNMVVTSSEWGGSTTSYYYYFYDLKYTGICASPRTEVIATVTAAPNITLSATDIVICKGTPSAVVTITSGASDYNEYIWEPSTGVTGSAATGWIFNPAETTNYRLIAKQNQGSFCRTVKNVKVQVNPLVTFTPLQSDYVVCKDDVLELAYQELSKTDITVGTSTTLSTDYDATTAFMNRWTYSKQQYIYTKQELNALGFYHGKIKGLSFNITTLGSNATNQDYTIKIKSVTNNVISSTSFETDGFTTVYGPVTHTHTDSGWQDIMFTTTYEWDGSSNLLIEIYQKGINSSNNALTYYSTLTTDVGLYQQSGSDTSTGTLTKKRLNTKFFIDTGKVSWSPPTRLYTDSSGTLPYVSGSHAPKVYFKRNGDEEQDFNYTATFTSTVGCNTTQNIAVKVVDVKPPVVQDQLFCDAIPVDDIVVTAEPNATIRWYASATGTDILTSIDTTGTYYVDAERSGCKSERISAMITIVGAQTPTAPATQHFCDSALVSDLTVTIHQGFEARWYDAVASTTPLTGTVSLVNGATYYAATYHPGSGCESPRIPVTAVITPTPAALPAQSIHLCQATSFSGLQITTLPNAQLKWYVSATAVNPIVSTQNITSGVYYVSQTMNGCESARSQIQIMMQTALDKPAATTQNICGIGTVADLVATGAVPGAVYNWYDSATSTTPLPLTTSLTSGVYYVSQSLTGCESPRRSVSVRVLSKQAPVVNAFSFCGNARVGDLSLPTTTNISYRWYATATSITELSQNVALTTGTYYVARVEHGCISERAAVPVTILPLPAPPTGSANQSFTVNEINEVTIADLEMDQTNIQWYISIQDAKTGNNPLSAVMPLISGQTYYAVIIGSNGCPSLPTAVTVDITLGIDGFDKTALVYYPNPVKDILNIRYKNVIEMVEVYNLLGQKVLIHEYKDMSIQLNMDSLASGSYLLKLRSENQVQIIKVVKK